MQMGPSAQEVQMKPSGQVAEVGHTMCMAVVESESPRLAECGLGPKRMTGGTKGPQRLCTCDVDSSVLVSPRRRCPSSSELGLRIRPSPPQLGRVPCPAVPACSIPISIEGSGSGSDSGSVVRSYPCHAHHGPSDPHSPRPSTAVSPRASLFVRRSSLASDEEPSDRG